MLNVKVLYSGFGKIGLQSIEETNFYSTYDEASLRKLLSEFRKIALKDSIACMHLFFNKNNSNKSKEIVIYYNRLDDIKNNVFTLEFYKGCNWCYKGTIPRNKTLKKISDFIKEE